MNAFARLGLDIRLDLPDDGIREAFRKTAGVLHPDSGGNAADFSELQLAQQTLLSPARRLREWMLAKGIGVDERGQVEPSLMDLFQEVAEIGTAAEAAIKLGAAAQSSLAKAMAEVRLMGERERVKGLLARIADRIECRVARFPDIEANEVDPGEMMRDLIFLEKWRAAMKSVYGRLM